MIQEIGIVLGLYVLTRLIPATKVRTATVLSILTGAVTVLVIADLAVRSFASENLLSIRHKKDTSSSAQAPVAPKSESAGATVTRADGGSITTNLGLGIAVAKNSSLRREWIAVHFRVIPVDLEGTPGVTTLYANGYRYRSRFRVTVKDSIRAVQVNFLTFDIWGNHVRTLSFVEVGDASVGTRELIGEWNLYSENDVQAHYASIGYVARVRLADGRVMEAPTEPVLEEARKFSSKFTAADLEPKAQPLSTTKSGD